MGWHSRGGASITDDEEAISKKQDHYPLFCLAPAPDAYFAAINSTRDPDSGWLAITTSSHLPFPDILKELQSNFDLPPNAAEPTPFLNHSIPQIYEYYNSHLRRGLKSSGMHPFTNFIFLAVDAECYSRPSPPDEGGPPSRNTRANANARAPSPPPLLDPSDFTILICTDAPDFYQLDSTTSPTLQTLRLPLDAALGPRCSLAQTIKTLTMTPSEALAVHEANLPGGEEAEADVKTLSQMPPALFWPLEPYSADPKEQVYGIATIEESRILRRRGLAEGEAVGWVVGKGPPEAEAEADDGDDEGGKEKEG